jgi:hypothetical protein
MGAIRWALLQAIHMHSCHGGVRCLESSVYPQIDSCSTGQEGLCLPADDCVSTDSADRAQANGSCRGPVRQVRRALQQLQ